MDTDWPPLNIGPSIRLSKRRAKEPDMGKDPGEMTEIAPQGNGFYGYQAAVAPNPFRAAPPHEPAGGVVYFGADVQRADLEGLLRVWDGFHKRSEDKDFAVFAGEAEKPGEEGYIAQLRIISKFALRFMFRSINEAEYDGFRDQSLSVADTMWAFIEHERARFNVENERYPDLLSGLFGGNGDEKREALAFGVMLENEYHGVFRIWSRAWLVTK